MIDLNTEYLKQTIGDWIDNHRGTTLGKVEDILFDAKRSIPTYIILHCNELVGKSNRYFAIPVISSLIEINHQGRIIIRVDKNVLEIVMGVHAHECPDLDPKASDSIYELYEYESSKLSAG